jgi:hypothetical protein
MNFKLPILFLAISIPLASFGQIPEPKNNTTVLYDSLVTYFFGGEYDSLNSIKILYSYDEVWNKIKGEEKFFWDQDKNSFYQAGKKEYTYDGQGNMILFVEYYWNFFINDWSGASKKENFFSDTLQSETIYGSWNEQRRDFDGVIRIDAYNDHDGKTMWTRFSLWDTLSDKWYFNARINNEYYDFGKKRYETEFLYDTLTHIWKVNRKGEWFYDQQGRDSLKISYIRNPEDTDWICSTKFEYLFSDTCRLTNIYNWDIQSNQLKISSKYEDVWDKRGNLLINRNFYWNSLTSSWIGGMQHTYSFDSLNRTTQMDQWKWDNNQNDWLDEYKETNEFDLAGHRIKTKSYWKQYDWELITSTDSVYDGKGNLILSSIDRSFDDEMFEYFYDDNNILTNYKSYLGTPDNRQLWTKGFYYWTKVISDLNLEKENNIGVYPNPASTSFRITGLKAQSEIQIIDLQGIVRLTSNVTNELEIPVEWLNTGIYLLIIKSPEGNTIRKIIKN